MLEFLKAIIPTVLTLAVGTFWLNRLFIARSNLATLVERICDALDELKDDCAEYWSVDYTDADEVRLSVLEAKIKGRITQVSLLINLIAEKRRSASPELNTLLVDLLDAATGGLFESKTRKKEIGRYMRVVSTIYKIAVSLLRLKIWTSRIGEFVDDICVNPAYQRYDGGLKVI